LAGALERGLILADFENLTFGMIMDYVITFNNNHLKDDEKQDNTKTAIQADFDNF
jgi:hypothetical protein